jgi:hypothetical protein
MEKRRTKRERAYRPARVAAAPSGRPHFCIVHNRTDRGFCIELTFNAVELPDVFEFSFDGFNTIYTCKTVWREDNVAGVSIEETPPGSPEARRAKFRVVS